MNPMNDSPGVIEVILLAMCCAGCDAAPDAGEAIDAAATDAAAPESLDSRSSDALPDAQPDSTQPDSTQPDSTLPDGPPDAAIPDATPDWGPAPTPTECFAAIAGGLGPDYEQFGAVMGHHCLGTNHQDIQGVEKVVFLGDSVTAGTPPSRSWEYYRTLLGEALTERFGEIEIVNCSEFGARTDDFLIGKREIERCFPEGGDPLRTLVVFTVGGNDIAAWAQDRLDLDAAMAEAEAAAQLLEDTIRWFKTPGRFPNGIFVIYANPYEYTDATGDLDSCELASLGGFTGNWLAGAPAVVRFQEHFLRIAVEQQVDQIFTLEHFCGHGFHSDDPASQCYRGPDTERWFDLTCIHPNPAGHAVIAEMFMAVVEE